MTDTLRIGDVAAAAGVPAATVRYYERRGLLPRAPRTPAGYRQYGTETPRRLQFIRHAQDLGFSLEEIQSMLALRSDDPAACRRIEVVARAKVRTVREQLRDLRRLERMLTTLADKCADHDDADPCPIRAVLSDSEPPANPAGALPRGVRRTTHG